MSRFEVECKLSVKDTQTGEVADFANETFHVNDVLICDFDVDTYVSRVKEAMKTEIKTGVKTNYSRFLRFVQNFHSVMEEIDPPDILTVDDIFAECEANLEKLREIVNEDEFNAATQSLKEIDEADSWETDLNPPPGTLLN